MKRIEIGLNVVDSECQQLVSWIAECIIMYQERNALVKIDGKVIVNQVPVDREKESYKESIVSRHTGYTVESEGLEKSNGEMECYPHNDEEF